VAIDRIRGSLAIAFLVLCLLLGGASGRGAGVHVNALLQAVSVVLILFALWTRGGAVYPAQARGVTWIVLLYLLLVAAMMIPLAPSIWGSLPGRGPIEAGYRLLGIDPPSLPASLGWSQSVASILWILPPLAMFLLVERASPRQRMRLAWVLIAVAAASIVAGAAQLLGGEGSSLRPYQITNRHSPVGFFANTNHFATLLLCALPLAGCLAARAARRSRRPERGGGIMIAAGIGILLLVGIGIVGSLAGYGLVLPVALASLLIYRRAAYGAIGTRWLAGFGLLFAAFIAFAVAGPVTTQSFSDELSSSQPASRATLAATTLRAIDDYFPVGSGLGTFQEVYRTVDDPNRVSREYTNHAHNDYLEIALELGLPGLLLVLAFILWWARRSIAAWSADFEGSNIARAGSVIILVVLLHSIVDFPIRTSAIASVFALACALLVPYAPPVEPRRAEDETDEPVRHLEAD
jgi:O-antigen ligase